MDMPETTEEFYGYLKSVKETDVMGNGQGDEIPFSAMDIDHLFHYLKGSFGIGNRGNSNEYIDIDPDTGEVRFRSEEHTSELQSRGLVVCRLLLENTQD